MPLPVTLLQSREIYISSEDGYESMRSQGKSYRGSVPEVVILG